MSSHKNRFGLLGALIGVLVLGVFLFSKMSARLAQAPEEPARWGITFSTVYARALGLDPEQAYRTFVEELGVRSVRLPLYWLDIEPRRGEFDFGLYDRLIEYSNAMGVKLTLVVGVKVPRWPECFPPDWAETLDPSAQHEAALAMITRVVERYRHFASVERWQVENEPFFPFGDCRPITPAQFQQRVDLVRSLDGARPVQVTVSGEVGPWQTEVETADILGISMYRLTWNDLFGYFIYPLTPEYYYLRASLVEDQVERVVVSELQAEPWFPEPIASRPLSVWYNAFDAEAFEHNIRFVEDARLPEVYLWGAEWWLLLRENGDERLWNVAKNVFASSRSSGPGV
ncbi:hypothetical protein FJZ23_01085 [Candidatus Parcubacteria bacterium]|nr:hypothetical protein [Candidatus Parcubacteria bacterium]